MHTFIRITALASAVVVAAGCASQGASLATRTGTVTEAPLIQTDHGYVLAVESVARRRGVDVHWVNYPSKRVKRD